MVALNNDVGRRSSGQLTVVFENDILGYYVHKENTLGSGTMVWYDASANGGFSRASDGDSASQTSIIITSPILAGSIQVVGKLIDVMQKVT